MYVCSLLELNKILVLIVVNKYFRTARVLVVDYVIKTHKNSANISIITYK